MRRIFFLPSVYSWEILSYIYISCHIHIHCWTPSHQNSLRILLNEEVTILTFPKCSPISCTLITTGFVEWDAKSYHTLALHNILCAIACWNCFQWASGSSRKDQHRHPRQHSKFHSLHLRRLAKQTWQMKEKIESLWPKKWSYWWK